MQSCCLLCFAVLIAIAIVVGFVVIQKQCYHGNVTSHFSSLLQSSQEKLKTILGNVHMVNGRIYRKSSITPPGGLIYFKHIWGRGLCMLAKTMVSVLRKESRKGGKTQVQEVGGYATGDKKNPNFQLLHIPSRISTQEVLESFISDG